MQVGINTSISSLLLIRGRDAEGEQSPANAGCSRMGVFLQQLLDCVRVV